LQLSPLGRGKTNDESVLATRSTATPSAKTHCRKTAGKLASTSNNCLKRGASGGMQEEEEEDEEEAPDDIVVGDIDDRIKS